MFGSKPVLVLYFKKLQFAVKLHTNVCRKNCESKSIVITTDPFELVCHVGLASFYSLQFVNSKKLHYDTNKMFFKIKNCPVPNHNTPKHMD